MLLTLPIREVVQATPRAQVVRLDLNAYHFDFEAGQAVMIGNRGSVIRRPYSIASAPEDAHLHRHLELIVGMRDPDEPGEQLTLQAGTEMDVEGPLGTFTFPRHPEERSFVFVAGGTGIAPLRSMLRHAILGHQPARHVGLLYSARTPDEFAFADEFREWAANGVIDFRQTITRETEREWLGDRGRIGRRHLEQLVRGRESLCFVCGPRALVHDVPRLLAEIGVAPVRIRVEEW